MIDFNSGVITVTSEHDVILKCAEKKLRDAYLCAMKNHFPFEKDIHIPREYIRHPQFNTWMELIKNQNQKDILKYAHEIIDNGYTLEQLNDAWIRFGSKYTYHEYKDTWKQGGRGVIQRLCDKEHQWEGNGLDCLIPHGCFVGLIGCPFICPDMVGGGEWTAFIYGEQDEELFVRMAEASALFPMMQFSALPWRRLSIEASDICKKMAELHEEVYPDLEKALSDAEKTGEPIVRLMEYEYPGYGYEKVNTQFMIGNSIISTPVLKKGETVKTVHIPEGDWEEMNTHSIYSGPCTAEFDAPLDMLVWFRKI